ncbi:MAG: hypothetical protein ACI8XM_003027, partial [Haloarculaceae archaeon]
QAVENAFRDASLRVIVDDAGAAGEPPDVVSRCRVHDESDAGHGRPTPIALALTLSAG